MECTACAKGYYVAGTGNSECMKCVAGKTTSLGAKAITDCTACTGTTASHEGDECDEACPPGYAEFTASKTCQKCPTGKSSTNGAACATAFCPQDSARRLIGIANFSEAAEVSTPSAQARTMFHV